MRLRACAALVQRLQTEVPAEYLEGVMEIEVSRNTLPHPTRSDIYTLCERTPLPLDHQDSPGGVLSRIVLYHGSFQALARLDSDFDWFAEAWDTLTHELRHHLEWRARAPDLEEFDWAAEQNCAGQDGERFDPLFYRSGEKVAEGIYRLDDDFFLEHEAVAPGPELRFVWHGRSFRFTGTADRTLP